MADYYPLLAKAVSGLNSQTPEARRAIYERARNALLGQLRAMQPPAPEKAIDQEAKALDAAIARLEREYGLFPPVDRPAAAPGSPDENKDRDRDQKKDGEEKRAAEGEEKPAAEGEEEPSSEMLARESQRPAAPKPEVKEGGGLRRLGVILGALAVILGLVGFAAWKLRDRPEDLARLLPKSASEHKTVGKLGERVGEANGAAAPAPASPAPAAPAPAAPASPAPAKPASPTPVIPVAYRAAVLVQSPSEPGGVKTYIGVVVWSRGSSNRGPNQQLTSSIKANVDIPDAKFKMSMVIEKNYDSTLAASHTFTVHFEPAKGSPIGEVKAVNMPEMRADSAPKGSPLIGLPVDIAPNVFLIGLSSGSEDKNVELIKSENWFDIPVRLADGRIAKVTFEKGVGGAKIISDVLAEWKSAQK